MPTRSTRANIRGKQKIEVRERKIKKGNSRISEGAVAVGRRRSWRRGRSWRRRSWPYDFLSAYILKIYTKFIEKLQIGQNVPFEILTEHQHISCKT